MRTIDDMVDRALAGTLEDDLMGDKKNMRCIIVDIDGTLADVSGGVQATKDGMFDWENFFGALPFYPPNDWCVRLAQIYYNTGYIVYIVSGRPDRFEKKTKQWLEKHGVPYDFIYMRKDGDMRKDDIVKKEILESKLPKKELIEFVVDDRQIVVDMWREEGLTCLQCAPHEELK